MNTSSLTSPSTDSLPELVALDELRRSELVAGPALDDIPRIGPRASYPPAPIMSWGQICSFDRAFHFKPTASPFVHNDAIGKRFLAMESDFTAAMDNFAALVRLGRVGGSVKRPSKSKPKLAPIRARL